MPGAWNFVGRERELLELESLLSKHSVIVVTGIAGVGKSALAGALAKRSEGGLVCDMRGVRQEGEGGVARLLHEPTSELLVRYVLRHVGASKRPLVVLDEGDDLPFVAAI